MDRSIEGDASIRVGFDQQPIADAFHVFSFECLAKHSQGLQRIQSQRRGHELKSIVHHFYVTYVIHFILVAIVYLHFIKPMISHQLYVDRF